MKNPFDRRDHYTALFTGLAIGAVAVGGMAYMYFKRRAAMKAAAKELKAHAKDYLKAKTGKFKKHKSDIDTLDHLITAQ